MREIVKANAAPRRPFNLFLYGQTKGGKTTGAWLAAMRLVGHKGAGLDKILFIDTESGRSTYILDQYPELADASIVYWEPPFDVPELTKFITAQQANYEVIVIDSFSAFYSREGGTLDQVSKETARLQGNSYVAWKRPGDEYNRFLTAVTQLDCNVIVCARAKMEYAQQEQEQNGRVRKVIVPLGVGPVVRASETAYEFDLEVEVLLDDKGERYAVVRGSRVAAISTGEMYKGGFDQEIVDKFLGVMDKRQVIERPKTISMSAEDFLDEWKKLFNSETEARVALGEKGKWTDLRGDGVKLARILAERKAEWEAAAEQVVVEPGVKEPDGEEVPG